MKIAREADAAPETDGTSAAAPQTNDGPSAAPDDSAKKPEPKSPTPTEKDKKPETAKPDESKPEKDSKESAFSKAKKEAERKDRSWKALEQEKQELRAERARIDAELQGLRREVTDLRKRSVPATPAGPAKDAHGATADDYEAMARRFDREGKEELADAARERAADLRKQPPAATAPETDREPWTAPEFQQEWKRHTDEILASAPELADPNHPLTRAAQSLVNDPAWKRFFRAHPDGIKAAVEVGKLMQAAQGAQELQAKLTTAEEQQKKDRAEIERLNGLLQPRGSHPSSQPGGEKRSGDLTDDDVRRLAAAADRGEV
jgi:hypothetical protein